MARKKWDQPTLDVHILPVVEKALNNKSMKKPNCPLCDWKSYTQGNWTSWSDQNSALSRFKRHMREKHRAYYNISLKPFVIHEEMEVAIHG